MERDDRQGEEFRTDMRALATGAAGSGDAEARRARWFPHRLDYPLEHSARMPQHEPA